MLTTRSNWKKSSSRAQRALRADHVTSTAAWSLLSDTRSDGMLSCTQWHPIRWNVILYTVTPDQTECCLVHSDTRSDGMLSCTQWHPIRRNVILYTVTSDQTECCLVHGDTRSDGMLSRAQKYQGCYTKLVSLALDDDIRLERMSVKGSVTAGSQNLLLALSSNQIRLEGMSSCYL